MVTSSPETELHMDCCVKKFLFFLNFLIFFYFPVISASLIKDLPSRSSLGLISLSCLSLDRSVSGDPVMTGVSGFRCKPFHHDWDSFEEEWIFRASLREDRRKTTWFASGFTVFCYHLILSLPAKYLPREHYWKRWSHSSVFKKKKL